MLYGICCGEKREEEERKQPAKQGERGAQILPSEWEEERGCARIKKWKNKIDLYNDTTPPSFCKNSSNDPHDDPRPGSEYHTLQRRTVWYHILHVRDWHMHHWTRVEVLPNGKHLRCQCIGMVAPCKPDVSSRSRHIRVTSIHNQHHGQSHRSGPLWTNRAGSRQTERLPETSWRHKVERIIES